MITNWKRLCSEGRLGASTKAAGPRRILRSSTKNFNAILT
jgi:hypothetical protein